MLQVDRLRIETPGDKAHKAAVLVNDVSFTLCRGEVLGLIGESGAGKSTIGLAVMGYTRPGCAITGGQLLFDGRDIRTMSSEERRALRGRNVAYVAQSAAASFNPSRTLMQQVCEIPQALGLTSRAEDRARAIALFRELDLPDPEHFGDRYPHQVSGGQLQRAMAAMAMAARPDIIVFDEPTTALDVTTQVEVLASFRKLIREHGTAAIYITHDLAVVAQIADDIMVLRHGNMVEHGLCDDILQRPQQDYTRRLVADRAQRDAAATVGDGETLLEVSNVTASYSALSRVVDDVSLSLKRGDTLAVVGESGSGKSTMARVIVGLLARESGELRFEGKTLSPQLVDRSREERRRIQMIYQSPDVALNPNQTLLEIIGRPVQFYFNRSRAQVRERVLELLRMMDLPESFIDRRPSELSGGQKQRVGIARALAAEPDLIICDEITSALDQLVGEELLKLLKQLQDRLGLAYLFITHDIGTVRRIANKVVVMRAGKLVAGGATETVFSPPMHPYTELLLSSVPQMRSDWLDEVLARGKPESHAA